MIFCFHGFDGNFIDFCILFRCQVVENYDARNAQLTRPEDGPVLLQFVDELFRSEIEAEDAANAEEGNGEEALEASASAAAPSQHRSLIAG